MKKYCMLIVIAFLLVVVNGCASGNFRKEVENRSNEANWKIVLYYQSSRHPNMELHLDGTFTATCIAYGDIYNPKTKHFVKYFVKRTDEDVNNPVHGIRFYNLYGEVLKEFPLNPDYKSTELIAVTPDENEVIFRTLSGNFTFDTRTLRIDRFHLGELKVETIEYSNDGACILVGCIDGKMYVYEQSTGKITPLGTGYYPRWNAGYDGVIYTKNRTNIYRSYQGAFEKNIKTFEEKAVPFYPEAYSPDRDYYLHFKVPFWQFMTERINVYVSSSNATGKKNDIYIGGPFSYPNEWNECIWVAE